jgi:hypothetical protein
MEFIAQNIVFLGVQKRTSKRTGEQYKIASFLGEDGNIFQCLVSCDIPERIKQLDKVDVLFVITGRYNNLIVKNISKRG